MLNKLKKVWAKFKAWLNKLKTKVIIKQIALTFYAYIISKFTQGRTQTVIIKEFINSTNILLYE